MTTRYGKRLVSLLVLTTSLGLGGRTMAQAEELCDPAFEGCRARLISLIRNEGVGIDVAFWFMEDQRYMTEIIKKWREGVPVRLLVDPRATDSGYPANGPILQGFRDAGIPMRKRTASGILHWKMMLFAGQGVVEFSGANYSPTAFDPIEPYANYIDEAIYFCDDPSVVQSFMTKYDELWVNTTTYANYANITSPLTRIYPVYPKDPELNFPETENYANRATGRYNAENRQIDVIMYRITDERHTNAMIAAHNRGVPVRLISDMHEYRKVTRLWHSYNLDRLYAAGVPLRVRAHQGLNHQKSVLLYGQGLTIFGSSNWTSPSANQQQEHNYFTKKPWIFQWFVDQFERKWNNSNPAGVLDTQPFVPLPPDKPVYRTPANAAAGQAASGQKLKWYGGPWAHRYDVYFGLDPAPPLFARDQQLGPSETTSQYQTFALPALQPGTTYYWRIVSKTMAGRTASGPVSSFTTAGVAPDPGVPGAGSTVSIWASDVPRGNLVGAWEVIADPTAVGGAALFLPDRGKATISPALSQPANYFEVTFEAAAGVPYHLWVRMRSFNNGLGNDSVTVQFSDSIDALGSPVYRIGSTHGAEVVLQDGPSGVLSGWGWADNGFGRLGPHIYFAESGRHTLRIQQREDGAILDHIVLSPDGFLTSPPGRRRNDMLQLPSTVSGAVPTPSGIEMPWISDAVGVVGVNGLARYDASANSYGIHAGGGDIWGAADGMHFVHRPLTGDGSIVARVTGVANTGARARAGVMFRETMAADSPNVFAYWSAGKTTGLQRRTARAGATLATAGPAAVLLAPYWLRLDRAGNTFTAYQSKDGIAWTYLASETIVLPETLYVGLAATSAHRTTTALATLDGVEVTAGTPVAPAFPPPASPLPDGWLNSDVGNVGFTGAASHAEGVFTIKGAGAGIFGNADAFHYLYATLPGDGVIVARIRSQQNTHASAKAGVMLRESLAADAANVLMAVTPGKGTVFQRRLVPGGATTAVAGASAARAPYWVKLERTGTTVQAYESADGATWNLVGTETVTAGPLYAGLAVSSHSTTATSSAVVDGFSLLAR